MVTKIADALPGGEMSNLRRTDDQLPLSPPVLYILLAIADRPRHGYGIMQEVDRRTGGAVRLLPGSLYSTIKRMLQQGLIDERDPVRGEDDDERRRFYGITPVGREIAAAEVQRLSAVVGFAEEKKLAPRPVGARSRT